MHNNTKEKTKKAIHNCSWEEARSLSLPWLGSLLHVLHPVAEKSHCRLACMVRAEDARASAKQLVDDVVVVLPAPPCVSGRKEERHHQQRSRVLPDLMAA